MERADERSCRFEVVVLALRHHAEIDEGLVQRRARVGVDRLRECGELVYKGKRWSPALCAVFMATGTILASPPVLWALAVAALLGAILSAHPFDIFYNHVVRHLTGTRPLPHHGPQRRFACSIAAAWLVGTGLAFHQGAAALGYVLGGTLTIVAAIVSTTHFCVPSLVYNTLFRPRPTAGASAPRGA